MPRDHDDDAPTETHANRAALVSIGAGLASFTLIDTLRTAGVSTADLCVIGPSRVPFDRYERALAHSGIDDGDRLRSESCSTLDNPWGFPGYALREAVDARRLAPLLRTIGEPIVTEYYTPKRCDVLASVTREATRISWGEMFRPGLVHRVQPTQTGFEVCYRSGGTSRTVHADNVHLAVGPGPLRHPPDSAELRACAATRRRIRHVYEDHGHMLRAARERPVTIAVRGDGIAASHAVDSLLLEQSRVAPDLRVLHVTRRVDEGFRQPFNVPKAAWGGQLHAELTKADDDRARELLGRFARTTVPDRRSVQRRRDAAKAAGRLIEISHPDPRVFDAEHALAIDVGDDQAPWLADFVIDATGFVSGVSGHPAVDDLLAAAGTSENAMGRLDVDESFAVEGLDGARGRVYVSGALAFGRRYGAPDTFLGMQYSAHHIARDLARRGIGARYRPHRSVRWWTRWARGSEP